MSSPNIIEFPDFKGLHALTLVEEDGEKFLHAVFSLVDRGYGTLTHLRLPDGRTIEAVPHPSLVPSLSLPVVLSEVPAASVEQPPVDVPPAQLPAEPPPPAPDASSGNSGKKSKAAANAPDTGAGSDAPANVAASDASSGQQQANGG